MVGEKEEDGSLGSENGGCVKGSWGGGHMSWDISIKVNF